METTAVRTPPDTHFVRTSRTSGYVAARIVPVKATGEDADTAGLGGE